MWDLKAARSAAMAAAGLSYGPAKGAQSSASAALAQAAAAALAESDGDGDVDDRGAPAADDGWVAHGAPSPGSEANACDEGRSVKPNSIVL